MAQPESLHHIAREPAGEPAGALVLLHGRGADEHDLGPLLDMLDPQRRLLGVTPRGPLSLPPGGAHWYAVREIGYPDPGTFLPTYARLTAWLDGLLADRGIAHDRTVLGGFSQGTVMSYATGLGAGRPLPAGLIGLSGFMPTVEGFELEPERVREERSPTGGRASTAARISRGLPVAIGHGVQDPVIGVEWGRDARERLTAAGAAVTYAEAPIGHQIDPGFLGRLEGWVREVLP